MEPDSSLKNNSDLTQAGEVGGNISPRSSIHTLEGDIFNAMKDDGYGNNIVKIVTDQSKKKAVPVSGEEETKGFLTKIAIAGGIFVVIVGITLGYLYFAGDTDTGVQALDPNTTTTSSTATTTVSTTKTTSVLEAEAIIEVNLKELDKFGSVQKIRQIQQELRDKMIAAGTAVELALNLSTPEFFAKNQYSGGEGLIRSLTNNYSFGLYNNKNNRFESFIIFKLSSPDLAFSNMLAWERYMPTDLDDIFKDTSIVKSNTSEEVIATTTPTSTTTTPTLVVPGFTDKVLRNTDSRVYTDELGKVKVVYGFINKEYLIITAGTESFLDVKTRLLNNITLR